jgi:hypothetical protein
MSRRIVRFLPYFSLLIGLAASAIGCAKSGHDQARTGDSAGTGAPASTGNIASTDTSITVNGVVLPAESVQQLQQLYPVPIPAGRYWYDVVSGGYGREGEPIAGQMIPGLSLGGALAANASRGTSGVFINGRQITDGEKAYLERMCQTPVALGRYWVMANGVGGYEGRPAEFNLAQCPGVPQQGGGARSMSRTYCDANGACTSTGILGSITTVPD